MKRSSQTATASLEIILLLVFVLASQAGTPTWSLLTPTADPTYGSPSPRMYDSVVYNPSGKRLILFGGGGAGGYGLMNDVWVLSNADGSGVPAWTMLTPTGGPPAAREMLAAVYDPANNRMIIQGGYTEPGYCEGVIGDVWVLANADGTGGTPAWTQLSPTGTGPSRRAQSAVYDAVNNRMIVNGGMPSGCGAGVNDTWVLTNANGLGGTPGWIQLTPTMPTNLPSDMTSGNMGYDSSANTLIRVLPTGGALSIWLLSHANGLGGTPVWSQIQADTNTAPAGLTWGGGVYDQGDDTFAYFGGGSPVTNAVWKLSDANGVGTSLWTQTTPPGTLPAARTGFSVAYTPATDSLTVIGGSKDNWNGTSEVWVLSNAGLAFNPAPSIWTAIELDWNTRIGRTYAVSWSTDLVSWYSLTNVPGNGATNVLFDSTRTSPKRFYKVLEQ